MSFVQSATSFVITLAPPANTLAKVCLPKMGIAAATLVVDGKATAGVVTGDYVCVGGIGSAAKPRVISRA
jgi:hypothetical protein|tara:strand:+ start:117 stop:326 length:210 start_codon:yes stop_codon:yes gene_type:complete